MAQASSAPEPEIRTRPLSRKMLQVVGRKQDPSSPLELQEEAQDYLWESASAAERQRLRALPPDQLKEQLEAVLSHLDDRRSSASVVTDSVRS
jgi:hypothetical protein